MSIKLAGMNRYHPIVTSDLANANTCKDHDPKARERKLAGRFTSAYGINNNSWRLCAQLGIGLGRNETSHEKDLSELGET
jgi:hypothetical protein